MINYFGKLWNNYFSTNLKADGILSQNNSVLERILFFAEELPGEKWEKVRGEMGTRSYHAKAGFSFHNVPLNQDELLYLDVFVSGWADDPSFGLEVYSKKETDHPFLNKRTMLGSARGKKIKQLFISVERKVQS